MAGKEILGPPELRLAECVRTPGRALLIGPEGILYVSRGHSIYRSGDGGRTWVLECRVPVRGCKARLSLYSLAARLLRFNIQALQVLPDGTRVAVAHDGIYYAEPGETDMVLSWAVKRGSRPINISADGRRVLFGEYGSAAMDRVKVRLYCSEDGGRHFEIVHEFPKGNVRHIHNIVIDPYSDYYWVLAGDYAGTPGIGVLSRNGLSFEWVSRGSQMVRAVQVLVRPDCLIYGSDTEVEQNYIIRLDKKSGRYERLMPVDGASLFAADFGEFGMLTTCARTNLVAKCRHSRLFVSADGVNWSCKLSLVKDRWPSLLFQLGSLVLPYVQSPHPSCGMFSGQAVAEHHNITSIFSLEHYVQE